MSVAMSISRLPLHFIFGGLSLSLIPGTMGEYDCDKYCWASCSEYFDDGGPQFSDCVTANVRCNCMTKISFRNPFMYFILFVGAMIMIIVCGFCYRSASRGTRYTSHAIVAQPITGSMSHGIVAQPIISNMPGGCAGGANIYPGNGLHPSANPFYPASPFINPMEQGQAQGQHTKYELPSEYLPPPEYNTCLPNGNGYGAIA